MKLEGYLDDFTSNGIVSLGDIEHGIRQSSIESPDSERGGLRRSADIPTQQTLMSDGGVGYHGESSSKPNKRKPHNKSRRGCATCKKRRVKVS